MDGLTEAMHGPGFEVSRDMPKLGIQRNVIARQLINRYPLGGSA